MSTTMASEQTWTLASIGLALIHAETASKRLQRNPDSPVDEQIKDAIKEARLLKPYLVQNPAACTPEGFDCCSKLSEVPIA